MPTSKNWSTIGVMTVGVSSNQNDVGGSAGEHQNQLKAHGGSFNDRLVQLDGLMNANMACNYSCTGISTNDASTQELSYEFGAISAEVGRRRRAREHHSQGRRQPLQRLGLSSISRTTSCRGTTSTMRCALQGIDDGRQHPEDLRRERRVRRADQEGRALVLDGAPLLGLRADPHQHVLRKGSVDVRVHARPVAARDRDPAQRQRRHPPDLADEPEEQAVGVLQHRAAQDRALDAGQHAAARRVEPAEPAEEQLRNLDVPLDAVRRSCCSRRRWATPPRPGRASRSRIR